MKLEVDEFKTGSKDIMLIVVFNESTNFRLVKDEGKATWVPKWEELERILRALTVIDSGNKMVDSTNARKGGKS